MKPILLLAAAGALCLPLTAHATRAHWFAVTFAIVVVVALAAALVSRRFGPAPAWKLALAFAAGVLAMEAISLAAWWAVMASRGMFLPPQALRIAMVEGAAMSTVGAAVAFLAGILPRR